MLDDLPDVLDAKQVAKILGKGVRAVYEDFDQGAIPHFHLHTREGREMRRVYVLKEKLIQLMEGEE